MVSVVRFFFKLIAISYLTLFYLIVRLITYERKLRRGYILVWTRSHCFLWDF